MLSSLRKKLTLICVIITGILLSATAAGLLFLSERQMDQQADVTFQNNINSVIYKLQSGTIIDTTWLSQLEAGNRLIIHIEDNGSPILYRGAWTPKTDRALLFSQVRETAIKKHNLDVSQKPYSVIDVNSAVFEITGEHGDHYQAAAVTVPASRDNWHSLLLLRDLSVDRNQRLFLRLSLVGLILAALVFLTLFSWWFAGRAIRPIEESRKKQVEFVAAASHELRSPLAVIRASLSALKSAGLPERERFFSAADRECVRMAGLIDDLLFLASADAGTWSVRTEQIEPDTLMLELYDCFLPIAGKKNQILSLELPKDSLPCVSGDNHRLFQAMSVLLANALSYTPEGGRIFLSARTRKHALLFSVQDNGPGVSDAEKEKIFDRFYRADPSRSKKEHYGLGLSVAREIAELHGGAITVGDAPKGGAVFTLQIPISG